MRKCPTCPDKGNSSTIGKTTKKRKRLFQIVSLKNKNRLNGKKQTSIK